MVPRRRGADHGMLSEREDETTGEHGIRAGEAYTEAADLHRYPPHSRDENIFLFVPNIIGYFRIFLAIASLYYMPLHPRSCSILYSLSCLLDALDGVAARQYNQATRFGAALDMVTDRCTTTCLLVFLATAFPRWSIVFQGLISLDLASHYFHMYATLVMGARGQSHKTINASSNWLLQIYYSDKRLLFGLCAANELCFIAMYLLSFSSPLLTPSLLQPSGEARSVNPDMLTSPSTFFAMPGSPTAMEMARANKIDSIGPWWVAGITAGPMLVKQGINVIQLVEASRWIARGDVDDRKRERLIVPKDHS